MKFLQGSKLTFLFTKIKVRINLNWKNYQIETANFFQSLGLSAETDVTIQGIRTKHDIDVLVKSNHAGFEAIWIIECKYWQTKVSKLHVLALRGIVNDTGADRGILLAENGFQSGAIEAANLTNVQVTSLSNVEKSASSAIIAMQLRDIFDRLITCKKIYWDLPKERRIAVGLTPIIGSYSGHFAINAGEDLIAKAFRGIYPVIPEYHHIMISSVMFEQEMPNSFATEIELYAFIKILVEKLEDKIKQYYKIYK